MNIEEFDQFTSDNDYGTDIIKNVKHQQEELRKKLHILSVIALVNKLEDTVSTKLFERNGVHFLKLDYESGYGDGDSFNFELFNKSKIIVDDRYSDGSPTQSAFFFTSIFSKIEGFNFNFTHSNFRKNDNLLELKPGISEEVLNIFLNDELKKIYEYNKMQIELTENNESNPRKMKV